MTNQITACESFRARKFRFLLVKVGQRAQKIPDRGVTDGVDRGQEGIKTGSVWRVGVVRGLKKTRERVIFMENSTLRTWQGLLQATLGRSTTCPRTRWCQCLSEKQKYSKTTVTEIKKKKLYRIYSIIILRRVRLISVRDAGVLLYTRFRNGNVPRPKFTGVIAAVMFSIVFSLNRGRNCRADGFSSRTIGISVARWKEPRTTSAFDFRDECTHTNTDTITRALQFRHDVINLWTLVRWHTIEYISIRFQQ